jgi:histidine triad (HIT) family protein
MINHRFFFRLARSRTAGFLLRLVFAHMSFAIPLTRLRETHSLLAFYHPQPSYPLHILIVPRRAYRSLLDLPPEDGEFQRDLFETVQSLVREFNLEKTGYRLIANGGPNQDAPILHFHLISEVPSSRINESRIDELRIP